MPLTYQQIITLATATAKVPAWTTQAQALFTMILQELCEGYDFDVARKTTQFNFYDNLVVGAPSASGPITLPLDWLRANKDDVFYTISGVKYVMIPVALAEFDGLVQQAGLNSYPQNYAVDNSPIATQSAPQMFVWPPPSGSYPVTARYYCQMPDPTTAQFTDGTTIPWFPNTLYLQRRLTGELMLMSNDDRAPAFLGGEHKQQDGTVFYGAAAILDRYLKMKDDEQVVKRVTLDRRFFGSKFNRVPNTKLIGW